MPVYTFSYAEYKEQRGQHTTDLDTRRGTVTVYYRPASVDSFSDISREEFFEWESAGWNRAYVPKGVTIRTKKQE
jgi:hypothetical protein